MVILIPFLLVAIIFILFIFCMVFVACYWRRHELKLQKLGRDTSTPVAPVVVVNNVPAGHAGMVQTGYYPAHLNASGPDLSSVSRLQPSRYHLFTGLPSTAVKAPGIPDRYIPRQWSSQLRTIIPSYRSGSSSILSVTIVHYKCTSCTMFTINSN